MHTTQNIECCVRVHMLVLDPHWLPSTTPGVRTAYDYACSALFLFYENLEGGFLSLAFIAGLLYSYFHKAIRLTQLKLNLILVTVLDANGSYPQLLSATG